MRRANIGSSEVLKSFRNHLFTFEERCRDAIATVKNDPHRITEWLRHTQIPYWKAELRRREDAVIRAREALSLARFGTPGLQKGSAVDEQKALRKAEGRRDEALAKIEGCKRWAAVLEQQCENLLAPVHALSNCMDAEVPRARERLEGMIVSLDDYARGGQGS
jgi:hypothetical protein